MITTLRGRPSFTHRIDGDDRRCDGIAAAWLLRLSV
jgi:hypothetical protein